MHFGHLRPAFEVYEDLGLAELRLVPCHIPAHRGTPSAQADERLELLRLAVREVPGLTVDTRELERPGPSYMVDTLQSLRTEFPQHSLCLILGMDSFLSLPRWHRWQALIGLAHIVVLDRPGSPPPEGELAAWLKGRRIPSADGLKTALCGAVYFHPVTQLDISASRIRELIARGRVPRFLLPEAVWERIAARGLYGWERADNAATS